MDRVLRIFAIIALLSLVLFNVLARLVDANQQPAMGNGFPSVTDLLLPEIPWILVNLVGSTGTALCLAVGVAVVACIQRQQRGWAIGLLALLFVAVNEPMLATEIAGEIAPAFNNQIAYTLAYTLYLGILLIALVPLTVLVYTFYTRRRAAQLIPSVPIVE